MRKCRTCKVPIPTFAKSDTVYQKRGCCGEHCALEFGKLAIQKSHERKHRQETKARKDKIKTRRQWVDEAQKLINAIVVIEDSSKGCISCVDGKVNPVKDSGHYFHRGNKYRVSPLTLLRANLNGQCVQCNQHEGGKQHEYRIGFIARYGEAAFDDLCEFKRKVDRKEIKPLTIPQVQGLIVEFKAKLAELKKRQP